MWTIKKILPKIFSSNVCAWNTDFQYILWFENDLFEKS